jgi:hypothetical protein
MNSQITVSKDVHEGAAWHAKRVSVPLRRLQLQRLHDKPIAVRLLLLAIHVVIGLDVVLLQQQPATHACVSASA